MSESRRELRKDLIILIILLSCFFGYGIGNRPFSTPDEGRYVEIPREMTVTGDWITPRLNGLKYFEKPVLFYWLQALTIKVFGLHFWSMRLWVAFFAILGGLLVYGAGRTFFSRQTGFYAAGILATTLLYYIHSRYILLDLVVAIFISGTLVLAYGALQFPARKNPLLLGAYACAALACLTKGLIGIVLPGLIFVVWGLVTGNFLRIFSLFSWRGTTLFFLIAAPWHILVCWKNPDFAYFYFIREHFLRYTTTMHNHSFPFYFFFGIIILGWIPWVSLLGTLTIDTWRRLRAGRSLSAEESAAQFFFWWAAVVLAFFSFSSSKLIPYILPLFPPLALLSAHTLLLREEQGRKQTLRCYGIVDLLIIGGVIGYGFYRLPSLISFDLIPVGILGGTIGFALLTAACPLFYPGPRGGFVKIAAATQMLLMINQLAPSIQECINPSIKPLAEIVALNARPEDRIFCLDMYFQDLPVYLKRLVDIAGWTDELTFGMEAENVAHRMMPSEGLWPILAGPQRVFVFAKKSNYRWHWQNLHFPHRILAETSRDILFTNK
ncbi:MAG: glycosyltransferase family 39 protein [Holosporales bacterium]|jgi:4-amino-4-deoxy-L-arabinose transferase-like glycosyltransferase|nr:glycosyltransferase family 39 protein [Holosporales bacterium]